MKVEWYALLVAVVMSALWLRGSVKGSVVAVLFFSVFSGGAAFVIGHSTVTPASFAVIFLLAHLLLSMFRRTDHATLGLKTHGWLAFYCIYGAATAYLLPRVFAKALAVTALSAGGHGHLYVTGPLHPSLQNYTTAAYLIATLAAGICAGAAAADPKSRRLIVPWAVVIAWTHIFFGLVSALAPHSEFLKLFRNATYAELTQTAGGEYSRITGVQPESSSYASFAFIWFVFMVELWLRNVATRVTFVTAAGLGVMLVACTSSTGYASLAVYVAIMMVRAVISPQSVSAAKVMQVVVLGLMASLFVLLVFNLNPGLVPVIGKVVKSFTIGKTETFSGRQRIFFARTALKAFKVTWGLGVGAGSFRSSSLVLAILGSTGVIGFTAFAGHFIKILKPLRRDTYDLPGDPAKAVGMATAWTACAGLIPQMIAGSSPDPGYVFAIMGGLALSWRYTAAVQRAPSAIPRMGSFGERLGAAGSV